MNKMRRGDLYDRRYYDRRGHNRRKKKIAAYFLRGTICAAAILVLVLIVCGILFIAERLFPKKTEANANASNFQTGEPVQGGLSAENPEQKTSEPEPEEQDQGYLVVLDPGHGGKDKGTSKEGASEKDINLAIALKMADLLEEKGIRTLLTREDDSFLKLTERSVIANDQGADLFVSVHSNAYDKDNRVSGLECYYQPGSESGKRLAEGLCEKLKESGEIKTRSAQAKDLSVLRNTECQSILVEVGFLTNDSEREQLLSEDYQEKLAKELVEALCSINPEMIPETGSAD